MGFSRDGGTAAAYRQALTRRGFLGSVGLVAGRLALPTGRGLPAADAAASAAGFASDRALRAAMHVHGSWSEEAGSWEAQLFQAASNGYDVVYLTDHDVRAMAFDYLDSLLGVAWDPVASTGRFAQRVAKARRGSFHLLAESADPLRPASVILSIQAGLAKHRFRTSVAGLTIQQRVDSARLSKGALYELILPLSYHPSVGGRPAGQYRLVYRFGTSGRFRTEDQGLTGVVGMPGPAPGSTQMLVPTRDITAIWPEMAAVDNVSYGLSFRARSPHRGAVCDVRVGSIRFTRARTSAEDVIADQAAMVEAYRSTFPSVAVHATTETSRALPHMNPFGIPPWLPDYSTLSSDTTVFHQQISDQVHAMGGLISYNHPFGYTVGPLLSPVEQNARRRHVFTDMQAVGRFGADILEVGYNLGGHVDLPTHLALWDTFSRNGDFLTGNGVSDDHSGRGWATRDNGFATGVWAGSASLADLTTALAAGRAFAAHAGRWPGDLDLLVDESVPMGAVSVSTKTSRSLAVWATDVPVGGAVQVVGGPVDFAGNADPATSIVRTLSPSSFSGNLAAIALDTSGSQFFRAQVMGPTGQILATSNPVWLLRAPPPEGIPPARRVG